MVTPQENLTNNGTSPAAPLSAAAQPTTAQLPSIFIAIEYNLPQNYRRLQDPNFGYYWIFRSTKTNFSARIFPNVDSDIINISLFDDHKNPELVIGGGSELIKQWSGDIRMTGNWRRRLRRAAGEALVLVNQRPRCPDCRKPLVLRERGKDHVQFFGCTEFPECSGTITIIDHDVERKKAGGYRPPVEQNASQHTTAS